MVIGLSSIVLQFISTSYSSRMVDFFSRDAYPLWGLFCLSIFYDLILMILLPETLEINSYILVFLSLFIAIYAYYELVNFVYTNINSGFDPLHLIALLRNDNLGMFDFIVGSLNKCDLTSYRLGLYEYYRKELLQEDITQNELKNIISDILRLGNFSVVTKNDEAVSLVFDKIYHLFSDLKDKDLMRGCFSDNLEKISAFTEYCARNRLEEDTICGINTLFNISSEVPSHFLKSTIMAKVLNSLSNIGRISSDMKLETSTTEAINAIDLIISEFLDPLASDLSISDNEIRFSDDEIRFIIEKLWIIGSASVDNRLDSSIKKILSLLDKIAYTYILNQDENIALFAIDVIDKIGCSCYQSGLNLCLEKVLESYDNLEEIIHFSGFQSSLSQKILDIKVKYE